MKYLQWPLGLLVFSLIQVSPTLAQTLDVSSD